MYKGAVSLCRKKRKSQQWHISRVRDLQSRRPGWLHYRLAEHNTRAHLGGRATRDPRSPHDCLARSRSSSSVIFANCRGPAHAALMQIPPPCASCCCWRCTAQPSDDTLIAFGRPSSRRVRSPVEAVVACSLFSPAALVSMSMMDFNGIF